MWHKITKEMYMEKVKGLKPMESFSDPDGVSPIGYGCPAMDTTWGKDYEEIVKCEMRKQDRHQAEWDYTYYEKIETNWMPGLDEMLLGPGW
jgi:hypothetical protein